MPTATCARRYVGPMTDDDEFDPWTEAGAAELIAAAAALATAVQEHAQTIAGLLPTRQIQKVFAASELLLPVVLAYNDAQFNLTGNAFPFGPLQDFADDDEDDDEDEGTEPAVGSGLSVVTRQDFIVIDEGAALDAGRSAYRSVWPDDPPAAADEDVTHLGRALYQYAHLNGWDKVKDMAGVAPVGAITVVQANEELLRGNPDDWPEEPFTVEAPVLYSQCDVYG
jgi:hypothetical protein